MEIYKDIVYSEDFSTCYGPENKCPKTVEIHKDCKLITQSAFAGTAIEKIILPKDFGLIGWSAFKRSALKEINLEDTNTTEIGINAFYGCKNLKDIYAPSTLKYINRSAFRDSGLVNVNLSNSDLREIEEHVFECCHNLQSVSLPKTLLAIRGYAFFDSNISSLTLPNNLQYFTFDSIFQTNIEELFLPKSLKDFTPLFPKVTSEEISSLKKISYTELSDEIKNVIINYINKNNLDIKFEQAKLDDLIKNAGTFKQINDFYKEKNKEDR